MKKKMTAHQKAVRELRGIALAAEANELLGSEDDLLKRLKVSRPTLRQAAAHVAQENLITVRRGTNGGYFAIQPSSEMVSKMAGIYLHVQQADLCELLAAAEPIRAEVVRLAALCCDGDSGRILEEFLTEGGEELGTNYIAFLQEEKKLGRALGQLCSNRVLELLLQIVYDLAARVDPDDDVYRNHPERITVYKKHRSRMVQAILENDAEYAELMSRRCSRLVAGWMADDVAGDSPQMQIVSSD